LSFPRAYLPEEEIRSVENANEVADPRNVVWVDSEKEVVYPHDCGGLRKFVEILYNRLVDIALDLVKGITTMGILIYAPTSREYLFVSKNANVKLIEAAGASVIPLVREGDKVSERDRVFYILTRKREVRSIRAGTRGIVVYVSDIVPSVPMKYVMMIVGEENVRRFKFVPLCG